MIRSQVQFDEVQMRRLRSVAKSRGLSIAAVVREAVDRYFAEGDTAQARQQAIAAIGGFRSGTRDTAREHDRYLADSIQ